MHGLMTELVAKWDAENPDLRFLDLLPLNDLAALSLSWPQFPPPYSGLVGQFWL